MYHTYILKSLRDGKFYYGHCKDIAERLRDHDAGRVRSTKSRRPFELHHLEEYETKTKAIQRENFFKSIAGYRWLKSQEIT
jgi:putative endonuclease